MPEPEYLHPDKYINCIPAICNQCGALVSREANSMAPHNEWHEKMDELIEWAKAVSKLFAPPAVVPQKPMEQYFQPNHLTEEEKRMGLDGK